MKYIQRYGGIIACLLLLTGCVTQEIVETPAVIQEVNQESVQEEVLDDTVDEVTDVIEAERITAPPVITTQKEVVVEEEDTKEIDTNEIYEPQERVISVLMKRYEFVPSVIKVRTGDTVTLTVSSEEVAHGFFLPTFGVNLKTAPGESATTTFVADKEGSYPFRCNVYCGEGHASMEGLFIVE